MKLVRKLKSNSGESLVETLISLLIICICMLMLATSINGAVANVDSSKTKMNEYYERNNALNNGVGGVATDGNISLTINGQPCVLADGFTSNIEVKYYINDVFADKKVIAYVRK